MHSARVGGPLEGVASSSRRENNLSCWGLVPVPPPLLPFKPSLHLPCLSSHLCPFLSVSFSVSRARLPSAAPHPFSWREARRFPFLRATPPHRQHHAFCTSCFNSCRAPFPPQDLPAQPPMGGHVSSPGSGSFLGLPYASKANSDWMSALSSQLWDVPLHQLSIPGEAPRARLSRKAIARRSRVCEASVPNMHTCRHTHVHAHTHTHHTHAHIQTEHTCTHRYMHTYCIHTYTHQHLPF